MAERRSPKPQVLGSIPRWAAKFYNLESIPMADQPSSIFTQTDSGLPADTTNTSGNGVTAPNDSELTDLLSGIRNERGEPKYKSVKEAIIGLQNAQGDQSIDSGPQSGPRNAQ